MGAVMESGEYQGLKYWMGVSKRFTTGEWRVGMAGVQYISRRE